MSRFRFSLNGGKTWVDITNEQYGVNFPTDQEVIVESVDSPIAVGPLPDFDEVNRIIAKNRYHNAEWTRTTKHRYASKPLVNPITFGTTVNAMRPGDGLYPRLTTGAGPEIDDRQDVLVNPLSFLNGKVTGIFSGKGGRHVYIRNLDISGYRFSWQLASKQILADGLYGDYLSYPDSDGPYLGGAAFGSDKFPLLGIQGARIVNTHGTQSTKHITSDPTTAQNVSTVTDIRMIGGSTVRITLAQTPPGGMPIVGKEVIVAYSKVAGVERKCQDFNQSWTVSSVSGLVITAALDNSGGDQPASGTIGQVTSATKMWVMGGSTAATQLPGEHADAIGQQDATKQASIWVSHNNVGMGNYQPGGIVAAQTNSRCAVSFSNIYTKFQTNLAEPQQRSTLAMKIGTVSQDFNYPVDISDFYIDATERPWVNNPAVSPGIGESPNVPVGGSVKTTATGAKVYTYDPASLYRGGYNFNIAPPRDFAPMSTVGPNGVHPGVGDTPLPVESDLTGVVQSVTSVQRNITANQEICQLDITGTMPGNTIVDIWLTNPTNQLKLEGSILKRGSQALPADILNYSVTVDVYPIDPVTHGRGAKAFTKVFPLSLDVIGTSAVINIATTVTGLSTNTVGSSFTFSNVSIADSIVAPANTARDVLIPVTVFAGANRSINSVTVSGVSASLVAGSLSVNNSSTSNYTITGLYRATLGATHGATGNIVVAMSGTSVGCGIGVEVATGIESVRDAKTFASTPFTNPSSVTVQHDADCVVFGTAGYSTATSSGNRRKTHGRFTATGTGSLVVSPTYTGTDFNFGSGIVESVGSDLQVVASGSPATAGSIVVFSPVA